MKVMSKRKRISPTTPGHLQSAEKGAAANNMSSSTIDLQFPGFDDLPLVFVQKLRRHSLDEHLCLVLERDGHASPAMHDIQKAFPHATAITLDANYFDECRALFSESSIFDFCLPPTRAVPSSLTCVATMWSGWQAFVPNYLIITSSAFLMGFASLATNVSSELRIQYWSRRQPG